ncbi:MAG: HAMP domain-containing sensor histidine kinase [Hyphomicrobiaceae bacterium]
MSGPRTGSLRLRLIAVAAAAVAAALAVSGFLLAGIFSRYVDARTVAELTNHLNQILASAELDETGQPRVTTAPADPRFSSPNGGLYWQIDGPNTQAQRSRSLWETVLTLPDDYLADGLIHRHEILGPASTRLIALERGVTLGPLSTPVPIRVTVALDRAEPDAAMADFRFVLARSLTVLGVALILALWIQVQVGLRPLQRLKSALVSVHAGKQDHLEGSFPTEIQPLVDTMNALLVRERGNIERARERAGDLAHGFKTPLTVLSAVSRDLVRDGHAKAAKELDTQIDLMGRHVQRELARARSAGATALGRRSVPILPVVNRVVNALERIGADRNLIWEVDIDDAATFPGNENDLLELIGSIADNAAKWAKSRIAIIATSTQGRLTLAIADDGPGIPEGSETEVLARGRRLDETGDGTGLGLSIVARIVESYGGTIALSRANLGGLAIRIEIPSP